MQPREVKHHGEAYQLFALVFIMPPTLLFLAMLWPLVMLEDFYLFLFRKIRLFASWNIQEEDE